MTSTKMIRVIGVVVGALVLPFSALAQDGLQTRATLVVKLDAVALKLKNDRARQLYLSGRISYGVGDFQTALQRFHLAYRTERHHDILFDMAACQARLGKMRQAFALHRRYVRHFRKPAERLVAASRFGKIMVEVKEAAAREVQPSQ